MLLRCIFLERLVVTVEKRADICHLDQRLGTFLLRPHHVHKIRATGRIDTQFTHVRTQQSCKMGGIRFLDIVLIDPQQLFRIECRGRLVDVGNIEQLHHLVERKQLFVAV